MISLDFDGKIGAIKLLREACGMYDEDKGYVVSSMGLKEAKEFIEKVMEIGVKSSAGKVNDELEAARRNVEYWRNMANDLCATSSKEISQLESRVDELKKIIKDLVDRI